MNWMNKLAGWLKCSGVCRSPSVPRSDQTYNPFNEFWFCPGSALENLVPPPLTPEGAAHRCRLILSITSQSSWSQARWQARAVLKTKHTWTSRMKSWSSGPLVRWSTTRTESDVWSELFLSASWSKLSRAIPDNWSTATRWRTCWSQRLLIFCLCTIFRKPIKEYQT